MSNKVDPKILSRIQALMNKTVENGCTEAEASAASSMIQKMLLEHNLTAEAIQAPGEKSAMTVERSDIAWNHQGQDEWLFVIQYAVGKITCCTGMVSMNKTTRNSSRRFSFIGTPTNAQVANTLFKWLTSQMIDVALRTRQELYDLRGKTVDGVTYDRYLGRNFLRSYMLGMAKRVSTSLIEQFEKDVEEMKAESYVLAKVDEAEEELKRRTEGKTAKASKTKELNQKGYKKGVSDAVKIKLNKEEQLEKRDLGPKALGGAK